MNKSVIVYGPQGCGKTRNAERLRAHFGLDHVIDDWAPGRDGSVIPARGALVLTSLAEPDFEVSVSASVRLVDFYTAMQGLRGEAGNERRERIAATLMAGMYANPNCRLGFAARAEDAVSAADALIEELDR